MKHLILLLSVNFCLAGISDDLWIQANESMLYEKYEDAIQTYESILEIGFEHENVYYNLGNAYYRTHAIGQAIWAYSKAKKLDPNDEDISHNLAVAEAKKVDRIDMPKQFFLLGMYRNIKNSYTLQQWIFMGSIILLIQAVWVFGMQFGWIHARIGQPLLTGLIVVTLGVHGVAMDKYFQEKQTHEGIVIANGVDAYSGPFYGENSVLFRMNEGSRVDIHQSQKDWIEIILIDGKKGWIPEESLRRLQ